MPCGFSSAAGRKKPVDAALVERLRVRRVNRHPRRTSKDWVNLSMRLFSCISAPEYTGNARAASRQDETPPISRVPKGSRRATPFRRLLNAVKGLFRVNAWKVDAKRVMEICSDPTFVSQHTGFALEPSELQSGPLKRKLLNAVRSLCTTAPPATDAEMVKHCGNALKVVATLDDSDFKSWCGQGRRINAFETVDVVAQGPAFAGEVPEDKPQAQRPVDRALPRRPSIAAERPFTQAVDAPKAKDIDGSSKTFDADRVMAACSDPKFLRRATHLMLDAADLKDDAVRDKILKAAEILWAVKPPASERELAALCREVLKTVSTSNDAEFSEWCDEVRMPRRPSIVTDLPFARPIAASEAGDIPA